jgi:hypothetical protein
VQNQTKWGLQIFSVAELPTGYIVALVPYNSATKCTCIYRHIIQCRNCWQSTTILQALLSRDLRSDWWYYEKNWDEVVANRSDDDVMVSQKVKGQLQQVYGQAITRPCSG